MPRPSADTARLGEFSPLAEPNNYGRRIATNAGLLAHQLTFGSDRVEPAHIDGVPVDISVKVGRSMMDLTRMYGVVLDNPDSGEKRASFVEIESHSIFGSGRFGDCSPTYCGVGRACVIVSPVDDVISKGIQGMAYTTPHHADDVLLDRIVDEAYDGASGYGDFAAPVDIRRSPQAMEAFRYLRLELGHTFVNPVLEAYAASLTGPSPAEVS